LKMVVLPLLDSPTIPISTLIYLPHNNPIFSI
jgi:hypothetical protein